MSIVLLLKALALMAAFGFSDRFTGGGFGWDHLTVDHGGPLHGRGIYYVALPLMALCFLIGGFPALLVAIYWGIYRAAVGFPAGTLDGRDMTKTLLRHGLLLPMLLVVGATCHLSVSALLPFIGYVGLAVCGAKWLGDAAKSGRNVNAYVETARGASFGLALAVALTL